MVGKSEGLPFIIYGVKTEDPQTKKRVLTEDNAPYRTSVVVDLPDDVEFERYPAIMHMNHLVRKSEYVLVGGTRHPMQNLHTVRNHIVKGWRTSVQEIADYFHQDFKDESIPEYQLVVMVRPGEAVFGLESKWRGPELRKTCIARMPLDGSWAHIVGYHSEQNHTESHGNMVRSGVLENTLKENVDYVWGQMPESHRLYVAGMDANGTRYIINRNAQA